MSVKNYAGQTIGYLTVIERCGSNKKGKALWKCRCKCGKVCFVSSDGLRQGTKSCGCKRYESHNRKHGMTKTDLHNKWCQMRQRCNNPNSTPYERYGKTGIKVCPEWDNSFESFMSWSFKNGYKEGLSLDRIDNSKGYSPENCRWVLWGDQSNNRRNNFLIDFNGETKTLGQWCKELNLNYHSVYQRMKKYGYSFEDAAFSKPYQVRDSK